MAKVVVTGKIPSGALTRLRAEHDVLAWEESTPISRDELLKRVSGANAIVSLLTEKIDDELLAAAGTQLKSVSNVAVGYNNIDVPACKARSVLVTNTPGVLTEATADIAMSLILMTTRRLAEGERVIRAQQPWQWGMFYMLGSSIQGRQLGIVGIGQIGAAVARRARAFGMTIAYTKRTPLDTATHKELDAKHVELDELLATSDVVSLHCPYSPETHHFMNATQLAKMKASAYLINTARGPVVDPDAVCRGLDSGQLGVYAADVMETEPPRDGHVLTSHPKAIVTPHVAWSTDASRKRLLAATIENVLGMLSGS